VTDWFPTILNLTGISYEADDDYTLDGVNQVPGWLTGEPQREHLLYNYYFNVADEFYNMWTNGSFAVRNSQYKLMHTYDSSTYGAWWDYDDTLDNDDSLAEATCSQSGSQNGEFSYFLFDLINDPYETTNLYDSDDTDAADAKEELYAKLDEYQARSKLMDADIEARNLVTAPTWKSHGKVSWLARIYTYTYIDLRLQIYKLMCLSVCMYLFIYLFSTLCRGPMPRTLWTTKARSRRTATVRRRHQRHQLIAPQKLARRRPLPRPRLPPWPPLKRRPRQRPLQRKPRQLRKFIGHGIFYLNYSVTFASRCRS
jgi:hypothetical protein